MDVTDVEFAGWLVGSLDSGVVAIDLHQSVVAFNAAAQRILTGGELADERWAGRDVHSVLATQARVVALLVQGLDGKERPSRAELSLDETPGQPPRTIGFSPLAVRDRQGAVRGAALLFRDLTPFERLDEQARLQDRLAALGQMAAGLAHELRNPLAGMEVLAGLLGRRLADRPDESAIVKKILQGLRDMAASLNRGLDYVRPVAPARRCVEPLGLMDECLARARGGIPFVGAVEREFEQNLPTILVDPDQVRSVITDLIVNALQAMAEIDRPEGHRLTLGLRQATHPGVECSVRVDGTGLPADRSRRARRELVITIGDTGPGIPSEVGERIFYPFFTTKDQGTGVGLANTQKVVTAHGGTIGVSSREGEGARFEVRLPIDADAP